MQQIAIFFDKKSNNSEELSDIYNVNNIYAKDWRTTVGSLQDEAASEK